MKDYLRKYKKQICLTAAVCLLGTAAFCGFHIYRHYAQVEEQTEAFEQIAEVVEEAPESEPASGDTPVSEGEDVLAKYRELYLQNEDMVGWIAIDGTKLNYPVMQTKNNPNFYLKKNFEKEYSDLGVPYIQENCDILNSDNLIIYGHTKAKLPTHTEVKDFDKLDKDSIILLEQIRTIDKQRLKQYIGLMPDHIMARVDKALAISLAMNGGQNERN